MDEISTLFTQLGTTVCSEFSESLGDCELDDTFEKLFENPTGSGATDIKTDRDNFEEENELFNQVYHNKIIRF